MSYKTLLPAIRQRRTPAGLDDYAGDRQFATTLARGMELLRCFTPETPLLGNKDLARRLELPPATITRLTYTLVAMGYLAQQERQGRYRLGSAVLALGFPLLQMFEIRRRARPLMLELAQSTGAAVSIGIRDRFNIVYIEAVRARPMRRFPLDVGTSHSLAGSAIGRAWLMGCSAAERTALLHQLRLRAPQEWARHSVELLRNIREFPRHGCCVSVGELYPDVVAVAVPLGPIDHGERAALNCSFQRREPDRQWLLKEAGPKLQALAEALALAPP